MKLGITAKPTIIGPYTFVDLAKGYDEKTKALLILQFIPLYAQVFNELTELEQSGFKLKNHHLQKIYQLKKLS